MCEKCPPLTPAEMAYLDAELTEYRGNVASSIAKLKESRTTGEYRNLSPEAAFVQIINDIQQLPDASRLASMAVLLEEATRPHTTETFDWSKA